MAARRRRKPYLEVVPVDLLTDDGGVGGRAVHRSRLALRLEQFPAVHDGTGSAVDNRRREGRRLGFGPQVGTVRLFGHIAANPIQVSTEIALAADPIGGSRPVPSEDGPAHCRIPSLLGRDPGMRRRRRVDSIRAGQARRPSGG